jgi:hypothetical protein
MGLITKIVQAARTPSGARREAAEPEDVARAQTALAAQARNNLSAFARGAAERDRRAAREEEAISDFIRGGADREAG